MATPAPYPAGTISLTDCVFITFVSSIRRPVVKLCARCEALVIRRFHFEYSKVQPTLHITPEQAAGELFSQREFTGVYATLQQDILPKATAKGWTVKEYLLYEHWLPALRPTIYYVDQAGARHLERGPPGENRRSACDAGLADCWIKTWMACHGRYTISDLLRNRPYADPVRGDVLSETERFEPSSFENLYTNWLEDLRRPSLVQNCSCPDRLFVMQYPPRPYIPGERNKHINDNRTSFRTFLEKYTDSSILDAYKEFCSLYMARDGMTMEQIPPMTTLWRNNHPMWQGRLQLLKNRIKNSQIEEQKTVQAGQAAPNAQAPMYRPVENSPGAHIDQHAPREQNIPPKAEPTYTLGEIEAANPLLFMSQGWNSGAGGGEGQE